ncbi:glycoside hydrolase family 13 protein [Nocardioides kribbensis]|uniref:Glycoside hydrolase family 13 protein n=1 Tax=Nocardioides kribbensis TaxID=305517 RepID=A0ABV1NXE2_9ACTN
MSLLREPHHDGSPAYLDDESPTLGWSVRVRCRVAADDPVERVWIRTTYDAEPTFHACTAVARDARADGSVWWEGQLPLHNPVTHYRFLLVGPEADGSQQRWLTAAGVVEHDGPDSLDFRVTTHAGAPDWGREAVVYQVFPDRFARSTAADERETPAWAVPAHWDDEVVFEGSDPRTPLQLFGGDLDGVTEHLDHLVEVGATVLYTTPVFPGESNHRYNASTFDGVDPLLGGDAAYARLAEAVHARGLRLLGDLTTNHTGDTHEWFTRAASAPDSPTRGWYYFAHDGSYECWMGHGTLPKLNLADPDLRAAMVEGPDSVVARWLRPPFSVDGWRIDVANMTGRLGAVDVNHATARAVRRTAEAERGDAWVIGEHNHDASGDLDGDGWHGTMNYSGFSWPVWSWLRDPDSPARPFGRPVPVPRRPGQQVHRTLREWQARYGWQATAQSWSILGSHDSARIRTLTGSAPVHRVAAGLQFTLPGVPMVFAGDEIGLEGVNGEDARRPMPWHRRDDWDHDTLATYAALARLRAAEPALTRGGLRWAHVDDDTLVFVREHPAGSLLVCARRAAGGSVDLPEGALLATGQEALGDVEALLGTEPGGPGGRLKVRRGTLRVPADGVGVRVWRL